MRIMVREDYLLKDTVDIGGYEWKIAIIHKERRNIVDRRQNHPEQHFGQIKATHPNKLPNHLTTHFTNVVKLEKNTGLIFDDYVRIQSPMEVGDQAMQLIGMVENELEHIDPPSLEDIGIQ